MRYLLSVLLLALAVLVPTRSAAAQINGTDVGRSGGAQAMPDNDDDGALPFGELKTVAVAGNSAVLQFQYGIILHVPKADAETIAATYGNPEATVHVAWKSGGADITLDVRQQTSENDEKFAARAAKTVKAMKEAFPPDPAPTAFLLLEAIQPRSAGPACPDTSPGCMPAFRRAA